MSKLQTHKSHKDIKCSGLVLCALASLLLWANCCWATDYYCDPVSGSNSNNGTSPETAWEGLQAATEGNKFHTVTDGDTVYLLDGYHGVFDSREMNFSEDRENSSYVTIRNYNSNAPELAYIYFSGCSYWKFIGLTISPSLATPTAVYDHNPDGSFPKIIGASNNSYIWIEDCTMYTIADNSDWYDSDADTCFDNWGSYAWSAVDASLTYSMIKDCTIYNVAFGIKAGTYSTIEGNSIDGFCVDAINIGTNTICQDNVIKNAYDDNYEPTHGDCIQMGPVDASTGYTIIRRNWMCAVTDGRPATHVDGLQGIFLQPEPYLYNALIANNLVAVKSHWGISHDSGVSVDCTIINNTVINCYGSTSDPVIHLDLTDGELTTSGCVIRNNYVCSWTTGAGITADHNLDSDTYLPANELVSYLDSDPDFSPKAGSNLIDAGDSTDGTGDDVDGNSRPVGEAYDIGAYEYGSVEKFFLFLAKDFSPLLYLLF